MQLINGFCLVLAIRKYGKKSWIPWIFSLSLEVGSIGLFMRESASSELTKEEISRRKMALLYYMLRSPFYSLLTK
jgi:peroxin-16